jgi:hypothetical protein
MENINLFLESWSRQLSPSPGAFGTKRRKKAPCDAYRRGNKASNAAIP